RADDRARGHSESLALSANPAASAGGAGVRPERTRCARLSARALRGGQAAGSAGGGARAEDEKISELRRAGGRADRAIPAPNPARLDRGGFFSRLHGFSGSRATA